MRPAERVWRKHQRAAQKGVRRGRRATHKVKIQPAKRGSTWMRRHPGAIPPWSPCFGRVPEVRDA